MTGSPPCRKRNCFVAVRVAQRAINHFVKQSPRQVPVLVVITLALHRPIGKLKDFVRARACSADDPAPARKRRVTELHSADGLGSRPFDKQD